MINDNLIKNPLVTIAIPIFNAEKYLREAILSCINQTYKDWELLLMCDGSTDSSTFIAKELAKRDSRIKIIDDGINRGLVYRLNQSVMLARGKYYARMDADDIMSIYRIEREVDFLERNPCVDVVGSSMMIIDSNNNIIGSSLRQNGDLFVHPSVMGKTSWFINNKYDEAALRAEDFDLWNRTSSTSVFSNIKEPLLFYRTFGMPATKKMLTSYRIKRILYLRYKLYNKSFIWGAKGYITEAIKSIVFYLFSIFGKQDYLVSRRKYVPVPSEACLNDINLLDSIKE